MNRFIAEANNAKVCICGTRSGCIDSRQALNGWRRRYRCPSCGTAWATLEVKVPDAVRGGDPLRMPEPSHFIVRARELVAELSRIVETI